MKHVSEQFLNEKIEVDNLHVLNEGLGSMFRRLGEWMSGYTPRDPQFKKLLSELGKQYDICYDTYVEKKEVSRPKTKVDTDGTLSYEHEDYTEYKKLPQYSICKLHSTIEMAEKIVKYLKQAGPKKLCKNNENRDACESNLKDLIYGWKAELKDAKGSLKILKRAQSAKKIAPKKVFDKAAK